ncbi:CBS domain-containing protein [Ravibacter arvi]|uniref:CBS domain-containing protein n=2 Tax=Ravibacter arvi TaxID=2051041 RepID=A0ABP8MBL5_9BACT
MIASVLIDPMLPTLKPSFLVAEALEWMEESEIAQLPVVDSERYLGLVSLPLLSEPGLTGRALSDFPLEHSHIFAGEDQHLWEVVDLVIQHELKVVAVLNKSGAYLGAVPVAELYEKVAEMVAAGDRGAIIVLNVKPHDYSLSEISRLVESNGAKIITSHYSSSYPYDTTGNSELTIRLNQVNVGPILATFERFGYVVSEVHANEPVTSVDQERLDMLMRYLAT